jgi:prepilin-type N-terminal cleavage/methylation domain-containing protein
MVKRGFTVMELIVVVGIFSIIMLIIAQPVANVIKYQRESQIKDNMRDNLQFIINKMEKELKTSFNISDVNGGNSITFTDQNEGEVSYTISENEIKRNGNSFTDSSIFKVINLKFWKNPTTKLVTVMIECESLDGKDKTTMQFSVFPLNSLIIY